jgi:hypothetical protein
MFISSIPVEFLWLTVGLVMLMACFLATSAE